MHDGPIVWGIDAGRQSPAHEHLSRCLWLRKPGAVFRFLLEPGADPGLTLERIGQEDATLPARIGKLPAQDRAANSGLLRITADGELVFCVAGDPMSFLKRLAPWAKQGIAQVPALGLLADAGAALLMIDPADDAAAQKVDPAPHRIAYDPALWDELLPPTAATIAAALAAATPGEPLWFWLAEVESQGTLPLIVQPVAWDPNHDRSNWLIDRNAELGAGAGVTGTAAIRDDGTMQFLGGGLEPAMLGNVARWVGRQQAAYPTLGRLVDCQLVVSAGASVQAIYEDPNLWGGIRRQPVPGTIRATAAVLEALPVGGECWFWITGGPSAPAFLHLAPTESDPEGTAFQAELPRLYKRFARSFQDAVCGVLRRTDSAKLLFSTQDERAEQFPAQIQALLDRYGAAFPTLQLLESATLGLLKHGAAPELLPAGKSQA